MNSLTIPLGSNEQALIETIRAKRALLTESQQAWRPIDWARYNFNKGCPAETEIADLVGQLSDRLSLRAITEIDQRIK